ncbi:hypothetical protein RV11_GL003227 [Enterococcus phoeniculicola]|jgi:flavin reductase (DIM6/NTAB) family NADH-FMN oxidoreductase RutF|uniref:Flavin reductase like domain-containing protein n=1 Tax=Enterococcus phoeniculicola ATCC BAA-412 TaxID=1158610 RepID=R3U5P5_9ENTE|nr:flavin reductase family protein [Enterococcus phoeniculicola]EOL48733.1 hypothetical protein UC3_00283 [Enterococcus phoeniculicola ATCC BAA-412]EOT72579.1 hypothetical protein I589_02847 [Enterococcus phoeniculicola ATCC BAA-412]OJG71852.1 hypothetical protein RV11_GL003227 [Enterococcus phoeniculicola]
MIHYSAEMLTTKQHYKFLTGSIIPRPIAWITTKNLDTSVINAAPFSYFTVASKEVPLVTISINRKNHELKDTAANLLKNKQGVIHIVNDEVLYAMNATAASLSSEESELSLTNVTLADSYSVDVPGIKEAPIRMEVRVHQYLPITDHQKEVISDLFVLEVLDYYFSDSVFDKEREYILPEKLQPVSRLAGNFYGHLSEVIEVERPS